MNEFPPFSTQVDLARYGFLEPRTAKAKSLKIGCVGRERCRSDYRVERSSFAGYGIEFVAAGRGEVVLNGKSWPLRPGTLFCYGPRTAHVITTDRRDVLTKYFIDIFGLKAASILAASALRPGKVVYTLEVESFQAIYEAMLAEGGRGLAFSSEICVRYLQILLLRTHETISSESAQLSPAAANFQRCRTFIDSHFQEIQDLDDVSRHMSLTRPYLCRLFQKFGQSSPFQYLTRRKLNRAAERLVGEGRAVKDAAFEVGYRDPYHFSGAFRQFFGMSPTEFVKNHRK
jgi:AraC-like DNA-binding protein